MSTKELSRYQNIKTIKTLYQSCLQKQQHMTGTLFQRLQHKPQDKATRGRGVN